MNSKEPSVAIVILSWNDWKNTTECIQSVLKSSYQNYDIILVDNNSEFEHYNKLVQWCKKKKLKINDSSKENFQKLIIKKCSKKISIIKINEIAKISYAKNIGVARGYNKGIRFALKNNYDYIFIDTPPTLGLLTISSLTASDEVLIPVQCEFFALEGLSKLIKTIEIVKSNLNSNLKLNGIILTMYDKRNSLSSLIEKEAREYFDMNVYKFNVPRNVTLSEAPSHGLPAIIYDLKCAGSQAYIALAKEFLERSVNDGNQ